MLSFQLRKQLEIILGAYQDADAFLDGVRAIQELFPGLDEKLGRLGEGGSKGAEAANNIRSHLNQLRPKVTGMGFRSFFSSMEEFRRRLASIATFPIGDFQLMDQLLSRIDRFSEKYERYIQGYTPQAAGPLIVDSHALSESLNAFHLGVLLAHSNLEDGAEVGPAEQELSIHLPESISLEQFAEKLLAIHRLYTVIARIIGVNLASSPLKVQKVESGSLWSRVFGDSKVIELVVTFLRAGAAYM
jgi:hypothetical protein